MSLRRIKNYKKRADFVSKKTGVNLDQIKRAGELIEGEQVHCENLIGATLFPMGVAGPLKLEDLASKKVWKAYIPLATTEGALVASVNRGCRAVLKAGRVKVLVEKIGVTRAPVFKVKGLVQADKFRHYLEERFEHFKKITASTSSHLRLLRYDFSLHPPFCYVRFYFDPDQAMGMNMATIASQKIIEFIEKDSGVKCVSVSGNFCVDKKPSFLNFLYGRGFRVWAEAELSISICKEILKVRPEEIRKVWSAKNMAGSAFSGSLGFNAHFANIVAAFFAATGQDLAHTVEGSLGTTFAEVRGESLYFSISLPAVMVGVVGGGTKLKTKREAIEMTGAKTPEDLAKVLAGAVLSGELSLLASLVEGSLAKTHMKLGR